MKITFLISLITSLIVSTSIFYFDYKKDKRDYKSPKFTICLNSVAHQFNIDYLGYNDFNKIWDWCLNNYEGF